MTVAPLRCGTYEIKVRNRHTGTISDLPLVGSSSYYGRRLNTQSTANVGLDLTDPACADAIAGIVPWRDELVYERHSGGGLELHDESWVGPIVRVGRSAPGAGEVVARDRSAWLDRRLALQGHLHSVHPVADTSDFGHNRLDAVDLWADLIADASAIDPIDLDLTTSPTGTFTARTIWPDDRLNRHLSWLTEIAVDWTVIGGRMYAGVIEAIFDDYPTALGSEHWLDDSVGVTLDGEDQVNYAVVTGPNGIRATHPANPVPDDTGLHMALIRSDDIQSVTDAEALACRWHERHVAASRYVLSAGTSLDETAPVGIADLIPGRRFPVAVEGADDTFRLAGVDVRIVDGIEESVEIDLQPTEEVIV